MRDTSSVGDNFVLNKKFEHTNQKEATPSGSKSKIDYSNFMTKNKMNL